MQYHLGGTQEIESILGSYEKEKLQVWLHTVNHEFITFAQKLSKQMHNKIYSKLLEWALHI